MIVRATGFVSAMATMMVRHFYKFKRRGFRRDRTKDEAVAMVKKAVAEIKAAGPDKAYALINDRSGPFIDRDLYIVVYGLDGVVLAHGADAKRIGTNQIGDKDPDGKAFVQERVELAAKESSFWQNYKFINPVTKKIEPKEMYCERLDQTAVCGGVYQQ